ncbi:glutathione peroxidase [Aestuariibaculum sp. TT11]|uniref:Glutathione peroxidase n=2 Tax=Aestuariibaculum sediminum TaxID=2770637 RepID=A0A8J6Q298_9FLAO|nr:glutathione peroxidase [Aestuariibaculum sediminum]MBD0831670.1 glutathione peroxidase [Aestuariibaculum sediminum]
MKKLFLILTMFSFFAKSNAQAEPKESIYDIKINSLEGDPINLSDFKGQHILFVNVASKCGFTGQYADLQKLYDTYKDDLMIIGVPCNQFGSQEPGSAGDIQNFCERNYGVTFLMTEKVDVKGASQHPLYQWLTKKEKNGNIDTSVKWNFQKYLVDGNGRLVDYYLSATKPLSDKITNHLQ